MAGLIGPGHVPTPDYRGLTSIFAFTNDDGELFQRNCGQAAAATLLACHGRLPAAARPPLALARLEREHPPDNLGGLFGTSRRRVERLCQAYDLPLRRLSGEDALRRELDRNNPVALMLGTTAGRWCSINLPGGHWLVAYAYDAEWVYVTNWRASALSWPDLREHWRSWVALLIGMRLHGLCAA